MSSSVETSSLPVSAAAEQQSAEGALGQTRTTAARLALNSVSNVSVNITTALISLFLTPFILRFMGDQKYGVWAVLGSIYAYSNVLQLGLYSAINRHVPVYLARNDEDKIREVTSSTTAFFLLSGLMVILLTFGFTERIVSLFYIPAELVPASHVALYTLGVVAAACLGLNSSAAILSGYQRYELLALSRLISIGLRVCLVVALLRKGEPLVNMALIFGGTELLVGVLNFVFAWHLMPSQPFRLSAVHWKVLRSMFAYGLNTFAYSVGALAVAKTGEIIIGAYMPPQHIAYYSLALFPPMMIAGLVEAFAAAIKPAVSDLDARNDVQRIHEITLLCHKYVLLFIIPAMAFFLIMGTDFYRIWLHRPMNEAVMLLYILAAGHLARAAQFPLFLVLAGRGEHRAFGLMTVAMGLAAVVLGIFFCRTMGWGSRGVAFGTSLSMVIVCGVVLPWHCARRLRLRLADFIRSSLVPAVCGAVPGIGVLLLWKSQQPPRTLLDLAVVAGSTSLVLGISIWFVALRQAERSRFTTMASALVEKWAPACLAEKLRPRPRP